jgi:hypothetical protein
MNIGLLLTYNEADIIDEMMQNNRHTVDAIFVLDGSTDDTPEKLAQYPEVHTILRDEDVLTASEKLRDYHRQVLLEVARASFGMGHWYTLMHGDEIFHHNPRRVLEHADKQGAKRVNWAAMQFFLHTSDAITYEQMTYEQPDINDSVQTRVRWYSPFWLEIRQFKDDMGVHYPLGQHGKVIPAGVGWKPYSRVPIFKHYPYRNPEQMHKRLAASSRGFSGTASHASLFRDRYAPEYRHAYYFEDGFGHFENMHLLTALWRWRRLVTRS